MRVILDSNILIGNYSFDSPAFRTLLDGFSTAGHTLFLSKVVLEELVNNFGEEYERRTGQLFSLGLGQIRIFPTSFKFPDTEHAKRIYGDFVKASLLKSAEILDFPNVSHETLVARALGRKKPFRSTDTGGYRDALLWHTILNLLQVEGDPVALVTRNTKDFCDKGNSNALSLDLLSDLNKLGKDGQVVFFSTLNDFVDSEIRPRLQAIEQIKKELIQGTHESLKLKELLEKNIAGKIWNEIWDPEDLGLQDKFESPRIVGFATVQSIEGVDVRKLRDDDVLVSFTTNVEAEVEADVYDDDDEYYPIEEDGDGDYYSLSKYSKKLYKATYVYPELRLQISFVAKPEDWEVKSATVDHVEVL